MVPLNDENLESEPGGWMLFTTRARTQRNMPNACSEAEAPGCPVGLGSGV